MVTLQIIVLLWQWQMTDKRKQLEKKNKSKMSLNGDDKPVTNYRTPCKGMALQTC